MTPSEGNAEDGNEEDTWIEIPIDQQEADDKAMANMAMEELIDGMASFMQASSGWLCYLIGLISTYSNFYKFICVKMMLRIGLDPMNTKPKLIS